MKNCSFQSWKLFMSDDNETDQFLEESRDISNELDSHGSFTNFFAIPLSLFIAIPNLLLIWGIRKTNPNKINMAKRLFIYRSLTDLLIGVVGIPYFGLASLLNQPCIHISIANCIGVFSIIIGTLTISTISLLRLISLIKPFYKVHQHWLAIALLLQFTVAVFFCTFNYLVNNTVIELYPLQCVLNGLTIILHILFATVFNLLSMFTIERQKIGPQHSVSGKAALHRNTKAIRRLFRVTTVMAICYLPSAITYVYFGGLLLNGRIKADVFAFLYDVVDFVFIPVMICPAIAAIVYIVWNRQIVNYYKKVLFCKSKKKTDIIELGSHG
ncbi:uncharacterized protein [Clytia hemisphaerica]|uniref:G-protein coupled receptors family 1 profile domain-containing protein n=1 Tax=Clytia hemisphaerica TaxID=252671 RepID=A0A7M5U304_9CNID|eukprot:TCONS_00003095-protein